MPAHVVAAGLDEPINRTRPEDNQRATRISADKTQESSHPGLKEATDLATCRMRQAT
jgi:hypothetical protein